MGGGAELPVWGAGKPPWGAERKVEVCGSEDTEEPFQTVQRQCWVLEQQPQRLCIEPGVRAADDEERREAGPVLQLGGHVEIPFF